MPTYEYECSECGERAEFYQSMRDEPKTECPHCGAPNGLRRLISAGGGIIFKGSGFYQTDYRSKEYTERMKKESGASGGNGTKSSVGASGKKEGAGSGDAKTAKAEPAAAPAADASSSSSTQTASSS